MSSNFRAETLLELTARGNVAVTCCCGHRGVLEGRKLARYYLVHMWDGRLHMVGDRLRCTRCRARSPSIRLTADEPTSDFGPRDERGWKQLVRRLRG